MQMVDPRKSFVVKTLSALDRLAFLASLHGKWYVNPLVRR